MNNIIMYISHNDRYHSASKLDVVLVSTDLDPLYGEKHPLRSVPNKVDCKSRTSIHDLGRPQLRIKPCTASVIACHFSLLISILVSTSVMQATSAVEWSTR